VAGYGRAEGGSQRGTARAAAPTVACGGDWIERLRRAVPDLDSCDLTVEMRQQKTAITASPRISILRHLKLTNYKRTSHDVLTNAAMSQHSISTDRINE
jgi:hypothetical protein